MQEDTICSAATCFGVSNVCLVHWVLVTSDHLNIGRKLGSVLLYALNNVCIYVPVQLQKIVEQVADLCSHQ